MCHMCANVSHVSKLARYAREFHSEGREVHQSKLARYAREFHQEGLKGQQMEPSTGEFQDETCKKMVKMGN